MAHRQKREVSEAEFDQFVAEHQPELHFDGMRYTHPVKMEGHVWQKPVAAIEDEKYYLIDDYA